MTSSELSKLKSLAEAASRATYNTEKEGREVRYLYDIAPSEILSLIGQLEAAHNVIKEIDQMLQIPAAEYVPAISDVFTVIDKFLSTLEPKEGG